MGQGLPETAQWRFRPNGLRRSAARFSKLPGSLWVEPAGLLNLTHNGSIKKPPKWAVLLQMAVGQGFEPREPLGSTVFKTAAFDHSASPPKPVSTPSKEAPHYSDASLTIKLPVRYFPRNLCLLQLPLLGGLGGRLRPAQGYSRFSSRLGMLLS